MVMKKPAMNELDLSDFSNPEQEAKRWMKDRFNTAFKLSLENPPFEHFLHKVIIGEHWFFGRYHHLIYRRLWICCLV
jgi:hypothetical protein